METFTTDAVVIGAGVVGLAIAAALAERGIGTLILEKNAAIGMETSSRNSEVIHAGIYQGEDTLKTRFCVDGRDRLYAWRRRHGVAAKPIGKLLVACAPEDEPRIEDFMVQAEKNGAGALDRLTRKAARQLEPELECRFALLSPKSGVVDSHGLMLSLLGAAEARGASLALNAPVEAVEPAPVGATLVVGGASPCQVTARRVILAAGLWSPWLSELFPGAVAEAPVYSMLKGNYFSLAGGRSPFKRLIYPAPVPGGSGTHLTLDLAGGARFGPDTEEIAATHPAEIDYSVDPARAAAFYGDIRRYWPGLPDGALVPAYSGVRPKAVKDGVEDFRIFGPEDHGQPGLWRLLGFESPALTGCLAIGAHVAGLAARP